MRRHRGRNLDLMLWHEGARVGSRAEKEQRQQEVVLKVEVLAGI